MYRYIASPPGAPPPFPTDPVAGYVADAFWSLGDIPSFKLFESEKVFAFLDINPLSQGHAVCSSLYILPRTATVLTLVLCNFALDSCGDSFSEYTLDQIIDVVKIFELTNCDLNSS